MGDSDSRIALNIRQLADRMKRVRMSEMNRGIKAQVYSKQDKGAYGQKNPERRVSFQGGSKTMPAKPYPPRDDKYRSKSTKYPTDGIVASAHGSYDDEDEYDELDSQYWNDEMAPDESEDEEEPYAFAGQAGNPTGKPNHGAQYGGPGAEIIDVCKKCGKGRHTEVNCYLNRQCTACGRMGHTSERCLFVCKVCLLAHPIGECGHAKLLDALSKYVNEKVKPDDLPAEIREMKKRLNV